MMERELVTPERIESLMRALNGSQAFREASADWGNGFNGNVLLVFEAEPGEGDPARTGVLLRLEAGGCRGAERVDAAEHAEAGFVFRARRSVWSEMLDGSTDPLGAAMSGRLKVEGNYLLLLRHAKIAPSVVACVAEAGITFDA